MKRQNAAALIAQLTLAMIPENDAITLGDFLSSNSDTGHKHSNALKATMAEIGMVILRATKPASWEYAESLYHAAVHERKRARQVALCMEAIAIQERVPDESATLTRIADWCGSILIKAKQFTAARDVLLKGLLHATKTRAWGALHEGTMVRDFGNVLNELGENGAPWIEWDATYSKVSIAVAKERCHDDLIRLVKLEEDAKRSAC